MIAVSTEPEAQGLRRHRLPLGLVAVKPFQQEAFEFELRDVEQSDW